MNEKAQMAAVMRDGLTPAAVLALIHGRYFVGELQYPGEHLQPVYELQEFKLIRPSGESTFIYKVGPPAMLCSIERMTLPKDAPRWRIQDFRPTERARFAAFMAEGAATVLSMRAQEAGLVVAAGNTKLPPPPGGT